MIDPRDKDPLPALKAESTSDPVPAETPAFPPIAAARSDIPRWLAAIVLVLLLLIGGYFRFTGLNWDDGQLLHPDERFIASTAESIRPISSLFEYFDTELSPLNPLPYGSYTYGMFPLFLTRYVSEALAVIAKIRIVYVGRALSGLFDLAAVVMLYFLGARFYSRKVGLLAAALNAAAVLPIQLSHYFAVDTFATLFIVAAFYVAAPIMDKARWSHYAIFGALVGLAMACKINTAPLAGIVVLAGIIRLIKAWRVENRRALLKEVLVGWLIAGAIAALFFRVLQPYAFNGPGFFGLSINRRWYDVITEVTGHVAGRSDFPPNTHWTNRPQVTYAWIQNAVWGMGLPLGLVATVGWLWAAWRVWRGASSTKGEWQSHLLLVVWVGLYFAWQNAQFWRYMRYFMPIYPMAILLAAWALVELFERFQARKADGRRPRYTALRPALAILFLETVTLSTYAYAYAFTRIYTRPHTRVDASRWILQNIPGPLNITVNAPDGTHTLPLAIPYDLVVKPGEPWRTPYKPSAAGAVSEITALHIYAPDTTLEFKVSGDPEGNETVAKGEATVPAAPNGSEQIAVVPLSQQTLSGGKTYYLHYTIRGSGALDANDIALADGDNIALTLGSAITAPDTNSVSGQLTFTPERDTKFDRLRIGSLHATYPSDASAFKIIVSRDEAGNETLAEIEGTVDLTVTALPRTFWFTPFNVEPGSPYFITIEVKDGSPLALYGSTLAMETSWDDPLPLRVDEFDPLGGIYRPVNLELFEPDTSLKRGGMLDALNRADYLVVSSNRAYDAMPRLPWRYPLTLKYYQALFDCPDRPIFECAYAAQPPLRGPLGYELVAVFESNPTLGPFSFTDQTAEEAFTVYDHPKVMIFKRSPEYLPEQSAEILNGVDLTQVLDQTPIQYTTMPTRLELPSDRLEAQTESGTWSEMFDPYSLLNYHQPLGVIAWYLLIVTIGWCAFPIVFAALPGLPDRGYPISKLIGLLAVTWLAWIAASYKLLPFTRPILWLNVTLLVFVGGFFAFRNWAALTTFVRSRRYYLLVVEAITLALFLYFLWIRWLNPDLWHPWLGGEKPADFSFFQSAIKSVYFPPYDAWLSGHYVNYYYYGYVVAAVPTKLLGIVPSIAYNLVLPTLFTFVGIGAFCAAYNLVASLRQSDNLTHRAALLAGVSALVMMVLLSNLSMIALLWKHLPEAADPPPPSGAETVEHAFAVLSGGWRVITGDTPLPGEKGRWYFGPSRAILHDGPDTPITEFPYFSFLYADLHPHLLSMSLMLAALAWMMSTLFTAQADRGKLDEGGQPGRPESIALWFVAGLIFGALQPTHTWDFPTYIGLGALSLIGAVWLKRQAVTRQAIAEAAARAAFFLALAVVMYYPFRQWFATEFSSVEFWQGARTPLIDYLSVHGLFLFIIITWLIWGSLRWIRLVPMDYLLHTPLGELLPRIKNRLIAGVVAFAVILVGSAVLWVRDYESLMICIPLLAWLGLLFLEQNQSLQRRIWLVIVAAGVGLTLVVELVTLRGDIGRSNTVFKFYIEVWAFFSVAAGAALAWLLPVVIREWPRRLRRGWLGGLAILVVTAGMYTIIGTQAKVTDRWPEIDNPPHTLDGMAYMLGSAPAGHSGELTQAAGYDDDGHLINLSHDYFAIIWIQDKVAGTPIIVEGTTPLYRWGNRIAIYTGLPAVVGWDWHLKQHDSVIPGNVVDDRVEAVRDFYNTASVEEALDFLQRYQVQYIIVGEVERVYYSADGLAKFTQMVENGQLELMYPLGASQPEGATSIYHLVGRSGG